MYSCCHFGCWCTSVPVYCSKQAVPWWLTAIVAVVFLDCDSICVGQQARCVPAFLLLLAAEWAAYFKQIQMHIMGGNDFLSVPRVLWWANVAVVCSICFTGSAFLKLSGWRGVEPWNVLAGCRGCHNGSCSCCVPTSISFSGQEDRTQISSSLCAKPCFRLPPALASFSLSSLTTDSQCNIKQMAFCLNLLSCPSLSWGTLDLDFGLCFAFNAS